LKPLMPLIETIKILPFVCLIPLIEFDSISATADTSNIFATPDSQSGSVNRRWRFQPPSYYNKPKSCQNLSRSNLDSFPKKLTIFSLSAPALCKQVEAPGEGVTLNEI
jgi:hypothetical protein